MSLDLPPVERKKPGARAGGLIIFLVAVLPLGLLVFYLLTYDYKVEIPGGERTGATDGIAGIVPPPGSQRPSAEITGLRAEIVFPAEDRSLAGVCWFEIRNEGLRKVRILDCVNPGKVLTVTIFPVPDSHPAPGTGAIAGGGAFAPRDLSVALRQGMADAWRGRGGFSEGDDAIVELLPGSCWRKRLDLPRFFDVGRPGAYEVAIAYDPVSLEDSGGADLKKLGVECGFVRAAPARFEIPGRPKEPGSSAGPRERHGG
ncbi:MAG: hypothetical protein N3A38_08840 [Planctomycetota bacterium]|nr:hypothetical protein [Planctomycetota bacterium]